MVGSVCACVHVHLHMYASTCECADAGVELEQKGVSTHILIDVERYRTTIEGVWGIWDLVHLQCPGPG